MSSDLTVMNELTLAPSTHAIMRYLQHSASFMQIPFDTPIDFDLIKK